MSPDVNITSANLSGDTVTASVDVGISDIPLINTDLDVYFSTQVYPQTGGTSYGWAEETIALPDGTTSRVDIEVPLDETPTEDWEVQVVVTNEYSGTTGSDYYQQSLDLDLTGNTYINDCGMSPSGGSTISPDDTVTLEPEVKNENTVAVSAELEFSVNGQVIDSWSITVEPSMTNSAPEMFVPSDYGVAGGDQINPSVDIVGVSQA